ncbi:hypothetical protein [Mammaliicoccus sciuri]|nr:hypothetical protein [Mammaliicoccus sciuri]
MAEHDFKRLAADPKFKELLKKEIISYFLSLYSLLLQRSYFQY